MKKTVENKLNKAGLLTKKGELHKHIQNALQYSRREGNRFYPCTWGNKGRSLQDYSFKILQILDALDYKYYTGNDAPRGGQEGFFIHVASSKAVNTLLTL